MKKMIILLSLMAFLFSCSSHDESIKLATGSTGGTYYPLGSAIAELITDHSDLMINAYTGNASVSNTRMLKDDMIDMALVQSNVASWAISGSGPFEGSSVKSMNGIASLYSEVIQVIVRRDADISSFDELAGKKVNLGKIDSGNYIDALNLFSAHGISIQNIDPYYLSFSEAIDAMDQGNLDAVFVTSGIPTTSISLMSNKVEIDMLSISEHILTKMIEEQPFYTREIVPAYTYAGQTSNVTTLSTRALWVCSDALDEETVYMMLDTFWANYKDIKDVHQSIKLLTIDDALKGMSIPLHPGAIKFYEEHKIEIEN